MPGEPQLESDIRWGIYHICARYRYRADGTRQSLEDLLATLQPLGVSYIRDLPWFLEGGGTFSCRKAMRE